LAKNRGVARILWRDAQGNEGTAELGSGEALIGRALECAIRTDDAMVSRKHARIHQQDGVYYVEDMGSANGIYYQERRVTRHGLRHGDAVRCGSLWLRFVDASAAPVARPPIATSLPVAEPADPQHATIDAQRVHIPTRRPQRETAAPPADAEEVPRLRRRIEQLQSELRIYRGGGQEARRLEQLEQELERLGEERDHLRSRVGELEATLEAEGGDAKVQRANSIAQTAGEIVAGLNDVLSNLRINVMAAGGEFDQFASTLPRASFELIREALRTSAQDMETAREMLRKLRRLAGG
jgi:hypothetical protein